MKKSIWFVILYWLPVLFMATVIFTASSQSYEQQNIRPQLSVLTDVQKLTSIYHQMKLEYAENKLYAKEIGLSGMVNLVVEKAKLLLIVGVSLFFILLIWTLVYLINLYNEKGVQYVYKRMLFWLGLFLLSIALIFIGIFFAFRIEDILMFIKSRLEAEATKGFLKGINFTYATSEVSIERMGVAGFIEFLLRKGAHFTFFFILGFLIYRALWASKCKNYLNFIGSFLFVVLYAVSDELHQAFTPNRTPLVEDIVLDSVGGLTGILFAFAIYYTISYFKEKNHRYRLD
ncbi:VanZ family protein [Bacillaceae bacterium IKA-2]|nr:VanZ family protein [Bacillaceae bacterium IKA-2]